MANEQVAPGGPPQQAAPQGADVIKDAAAGIAQSAESEMQAAQAISQAGSREAGELLMQAAQLKMKALEALGVGGGGPQESLGAQGADVAGTTAQPVDPRTRG